MKQSFAISGMDCVEETALLQKALGKVVDAEHLAFDLMQGRMTIDCDPNVVSPDRIIELVATTGLRATPWTEAIAKGPSRRHVDRRWLMTLTSGGCTLVGFLLHASTVGLTRALSEAGSSPSPVSKASLLAAIVLGTWSVLPRAAMALRQFRPDMNLLMVIAIVGAVALGEWLEGATVAFLFSLSLTLEAWSVGRARHAVEALLDLAAPRAIVVDATGATFEVDPGAVAIGSKIVLKPGARVPLDGRVVRGASSIDQAPITGESVPVAKQPGDAVFAGTVNGDGALVVETTKAATDTTLAHIVRQVQDAHSRRAPSEQWVEKFARVYTPIVILLAMALAVVPPGVFGQSWSEWLYRALVLLVIACPCALVISTPVSIVAGMTSAARNGVLIKGGVHLESPAGIRALAFDKTGTLTVGRPTVVKVVPLFDHDERQLLERAAGLEASSNHPLAKAILEYASNQGVPIAPADNLRNVSGKGATAEWNGRKFWIGSHRFLEESGMETPEVHEALETLSRQGKTVVVIGNERHVCGYIALEDRVRPTAKAALAELRQLGVQRLIMLTGDNQSTGEAIGKEAGIDEVQANLLPSDKVDAIASLVDQFDRVAMVGDGINDAPALARSTLGIAMGAAGSDAAIETADIALMTDDLRRLPWLVRHSRRTIGIVRQNIAFSLGVKVLFLALTLFGSAHLWAAIAADTGASLLVVLNGLRLLRP